MPEQTVILVAVGFPGGDTVAAGRIWVNGAEVPVSVRPEEHRGDPVDAYVGHSLLPEGRAQGRREVTVEATSRDGRTVIYTWRFTFLE
jgi:hypothetical protein